MRDDTDFDVLTRWAALDARAALGEADRAAVRASMAVRDWVLRGLRDDPGSSDTLAGLVTLGRIFALSHASPSLPARTIAHLTSVALHAFDVGTAAASVFEGYASTLAEEAARASMDAWDFPAGVVPLAAHQWAVAASIPTEDPDRLDRWSSRLASAAARQGIRRVVATGRPLPLAFLEEALDIVGVEVEVFAWTPGAKLANK